MTRRFLAQMRARGYGVIVNDVGTGGEKLDYDYIAGAAGNASLMAFTLAIGSRSLYDGVRVVGVNPGPVETDCIQQFMAQKAERELGDAGRARAFYANWPQERFGRTKWRISSSSWPRPVRATFPEPSSRSTVGW